MPTFELPKSIAPKGGKLVLKDLTANDEIEAAKEAKAKGDTALALLHALSKRHLVSWCGEVVSWEDGKIDETWEKMGRRARRFIMDAVSAEFYGTDEEDLKGFLASRTDT